MSLKNLARSEAAEMAAVPPDYAPPLSAEARNEIAEAILAAPGAARARSAEAPVTPIGEARRRRPRTTWLAVALPLAAAAALALALGPLSGPRFAPLPTYEVSATGGIKELRSGEAAGSGRQGSSTAKPERIGRKMELVVVGRPDTAVEGPVAVRTFLVQGARVLEAKPRVEIASSGAVEVRVRPADAAVDGAGRWILRVLIGRPDSVRAVAPIDASGVASDQPGRRWLTLPLDVVD
jgi:hypothetical protein